MAKAAFSDVFLRAVEPPSKGQFCLWDEKLPSFGLRVSQGGSKTFVLNHRNNFLTIGRFPLVSLSQARTEAKRILAERTLGRIRPRSITYQQAAKLFIEDKKRSRRETTAEQYEWFLGRLDLGQLADIRHEDIERQLAKIGSKSTYDHVLIAARIFFNWAIKRRYVENNPTAGLSPHGTPQRARVLTDEELGRIWRACERSGDEPRLPRGNSSERRTELLSGLSAPRLPASFCTIVKLLMLTGQRRGEIAQLQTSWIKQDQIILPSHITKNGREHTIPTGALTAGLLANCTSSCGSNTLLFPARGRPAAPFNGFSKASVALWKITGIEGATLHDIRRTYRTIHARIGTPPHIAERLVNHVSSRSAVDRIYDRHTYLPEMREAMERYEAHIAQITEK